MASRSFRSAVVGEPYDQNKRPEPLASVEAIEAIEAMATGAVSGAVIRTSLAQLTALSAPSGTMGWVVGDPTPTNSAIYERLGSSWVRRADLPFGTLLLTDTGTGTPNDIVATSGIGLPWGRQAVLIIDNVDKTNDGPMTLAVNGATPKPLKTISGNDVPPGAVNSGDQIIFRELSTHFRLLYALDAAADAVAAEEARIEAVAAAAVASGAMSAVILADNRFTSKATAEAWTPAAAPLFIRTAGFAAPGDGGAGKYIKVNDEPAHPGKLMITLDDGVTEVWYELDRTRRLCPEMFGEIGIDPAGDTAAWVALMETCNAFGKARIRADGEYLIDGSDVLFENANGVETAYVEFGGAIFRQQSAYSKTIGFKELKRVTIKGKAEFYGLGGATAAAELNMASGTNNGVAGIYTLSCDYVFVEDVDCYDHGGCGLFLHDTRKKRSVKGCTIIGIGEPYVVAVDNGGYFGIGGWTPSPTIQAGLGWQCEDVFEDNEIHGHSFGLQSVAVRALRVRGNTISCLGQHCLYTIECRNWHVTGNNLSGAPQCAFKAALENYAGKYVGDAWDTLTEYVEGDLVRNDFLSYVCLADHTSGTFSTDLAGGKWKLSSYNYHRAGDFSGNIINGCTEGLQMVQQGNPNGAPGKDNYYYDLVARGNVISDATGRAFYINACVNGSITDNTVTDMLYGVYALNFSGTIALNRFTRTGQSAIGIGLVGPTFIALNTYVDCGFSGSGSTRTPVRIWTGQDLPSRDAAPRLFDAFNTYVFTGGGDAAGDHLFYCDDANVVLTMVGSMGTASAKTFRHSGTLDYSSRNHVVLWHNSAHGPKDYTIGAYTTQRTLDPASDDLSTLRQIVATLASDLMLMKDLR